MWEPPHYLLTGMALPFFYLYHFSIILPSTSMSLTLSLPWRFFSQNPGCVSHFPIPATCPTHVIPFDFTTLIIFGEELFWLHAERTCENCTVVREDIVAGCQGTGRAVYSKRSLCLWSFGQGKETVMNSVQRPSWCAPGKAEVFQRIGVA
jgi:hypothetical protein